MLLCVDQPVMPELGVCRSQQRPLKGELVAAVGPKQITQMERKWSQILGGRMLNEQVFVVEVGWITQRPELSADDRLGQ